MNAIAPKIISQARRIAMQKLGRGSKIKGEPGVDGTRRPATQREIAAMLPTDNVQPSGIPKQSNNARTAKWNWILFAREGDSIRISSSRNIGSGCEMTGGILLSDKEVKSLIAFARSKNHKQRHRRETSIVTKEKLVSNAESFTRHVIGDIFKQKTTDAQVKRVARKVAKGMFFLLDKPSRRVHRD